MTAYNPKRDCIKGCITKQMCGTYDRSLDMCSCEGHCEAP